MDKILLVFFMLLTGCTTTKIVEYDSQNSKYSIEVRLGDYIQLTTKNGVQHSLKVSSVSETVIKGDQKSFNIDEIEAIEKTELTTGGAVAAAGAGVVLGVILSALTTAFFMLIIL